MSSFGENATIERIEEGLLVTTQTSVELTPNIRSSDFILPGDQIQEMPRKIIINYIPEQMTHNELRQLCATRGHLTDFNMVYDLHTGLRRGYAFAEYSRSKEAVEAANQLNGFRVGENHLKVAISKPQDPSICNANLHITGIPKNWSILDLFTYFRFLGQVVNCKLLIIPTIPGNRGIAFVRFANHQQASDVRSRLNGHTPYGEHDPLIMSFAHSNGPRAIRRHAANANMSSHSTSTTVQPQTNSGNTQSQVPQPGSSYLRTLPAPQPVRINLPPPSQQEIANFMTLHRPLFVGLPRPVRQYFNSWPIFVGNLDTTQGETFLRMVFQQYGALESVRIMDKGTPHGQGYGFVNMWNPDEAIVAVLSLNGKEANGRKLAVQFKPLKF